MGGGKVDRSEGGERSGLSQGQRRENHWSLPCELSDDLLLSSCWSLPVYRSFDSKLTDARGERFSNSEESESKLGEAYQISYEIY